MKSNLQVVEKPPVLPQKLVDAERCRLNGDHEIAAKFAIDYLGEDFDSVPAMVICAQIFIDTKRFGLAAVMLRRAAQLRPDLHIVWSTLGLCYEENQDLGEAEKCFLKALSIDPNDYISLNNIASVYIKRNEPQKALNCSEKACRLRPDDKVLRSHIAQANLMLGRWKEGWSDYDANLGVVNGRRERTYGPIPRWTGVNGLNLIVHGEQGLGDEISFASCIPDVMKENNIVIECDSRLQKLFQRSFDVPVYGTLYYKGGLEWPLEHNIDAKVAIGSLPGFYRNSDESFLGTPYLKADPERRIQWRALLDSMDKKKKIGIAWTGGIRKTCTDARSIDVKEMMPILRQDATFISLQYRPAPELAALYRETGIAVHHWPHATETNDYDDTAALIAELDLIITVQTGAVHMAGALGVPCWVMVPSDGALWRYGTTGSKFAWANSVKIYRKTGKWVETIAEVATDLREFEREN